MMLYGDDIVDATILGCQTSRVTHGHRFMAPEAITIPNADLYASLLETEGYVIADFAKRRKMICDEARNKVKLIKNGRLPDLDVIPEFVDELAGLVEWPVVLLGHFDETFLKIPSVALRAAMLDHQRYLPVFGSGIDLLPYFVMVSNIQSQDEKHIIHGNERVLRARLADAAFFYEEDKKENLENRVEQLKGMIFQAKLGTLYDKTKRLEKLAAFIAGKISVNEAEAVRAAFLSKADLTTDMVREFPELQGFMGYEYIKHDEQESVARGVLEQYLPRIAGDRLPESKIGQILALADRVDMLIGMFGINQVPTGDKDPYGLRRAALGLIRILIENKINLDLKELIEFSYQHYHPALANKETAQQVLHFIQERLRVWYQEKSISADIFAAVAALNVTNLLDVDARIKAVQAFKKLAAAETLSIANKRVSNILNKYTEVMTAKEVDPNFFENAAEKILAEQLAAKQESVVSLYQTKKYDEVLLELAELRQPIDAFFDQVMVMTDNKKQRENRILLLSQLRALFLQVADIALLQSTQS